MKIKVSNIFWGVFFLLAATFVVINQLDGFINIGVGSIIAALLSLLFIVVCIADLRFTMLPVPFAVLYLVFQAPLDLPVIRTGTLILASVLASIGLTILFSRKKHQRAHFICGHYGKSKDRGQKQAKEIDNDNNPSVSVNFGEISRSLRAENLETAHLDCNFGSLEIYFDQAVPAPDGAEVNINCKFGAVKLLVPKHWQVIDKINCSLGGVDIDKNFFNTPAENAPKLTLTGNVSFSGIEVRYI